MTGMRCAHLPVTIRAKRRCALCGHRVPVNGVPPVETRKQPPATWLAELLDRRRARLVGRWTGMGATS